MKLADFGELLVPWQLQGSSLNGDEAEELRRRRQLPATITPNPTQLRGTVPAANTRKKTMANYADIARRAAEAAKKYAPEVIDRTKLALRQVTNGKVSSLDQVGSYVGNNPARMKVTTDAMLTSGIMLGDVLPRDVIGMDEQLQQIRRSAELLVDKLRTRFDSGSDKTLVTDESQIAADVLRKKRVQVALQIFGSPANYFLVNPNGGIPAQDFSWYASMFQRG